MFELVIGGSGSGKSQYAEDRLMEQPGRRLYIATMQPFGREAHARIARHHTLRAGKGFLTLECYHRLDTLALPGAEGILLECMGNLLANEMFSGEKKEEERSLCQRIYDGVLGLRRQCQRLLVVTNDVFADGQRYDQDTLRYQALLAELNALLAKEAHWVTEVVCGLPLALKREDTCND